MSGVGWHEIRGGFLFAVVVLAAVYAARWLARALLTYEPHCVYRIPLTDGRVYIGYARDPDVRLKRHRQYQRGLPPGHPRKWWDAVPAHVRRSMTMPPQWTKWYRSKSVAEQMETRAIREAEESGTVVLANRIKYKGVSVRDAS